MKQVLIDECLPRGLRRWLANVHAVTVQDRGWGGIKNGRLLQLAESEFDVFLSADSSLKYQQNLQGRVIAIIILPTNDAKALRAMMSEIQSAVESISKGEYLELPQS